MTFSWIRAIADRLCNDCACWLTARLVTAWLPDDLYLTINWSVAAAAAVAVGNLPASSLIRMSVHVSAAYFSGHSLRNCRRSIRRLAPSSTAGS